VKRLIFLAILGGCAQQQLPPNIPTNTANLPAVAVMYDSKIQQMSRNEVIQATHECESTGLRPVPIITKRLISGMMSEMIVDVVCMPKYKY
jgi:hypothetical protein